MGHGFEPQDEKPGTRVVLLSNPLWRDKFHADPLVVGRTITLNREEFTVIGVMPAGFQFPPASLTDVWTTSAVDTGAPKVQRGYNWLSVIARLKPAVTRAQAQADMDIIARRLVREYPETNAQRTSVRIVPELETVVGTSRLPFAILLGVVAGVLLIACVNLANLLLARNLARTREMAVRAALGANRFRMVSQHVTESVLLSVLGGLCGVALAFWGTHALLSVLSSAIPRSSEIVVDGRVLLFALILSLGTGILFGFIPALRISNVEPETSFRDIRQTATENRHQRRWRGVLVSVEAALAVLLLTAAVLLITSYIRLMRVDPGINARDVLTFDLDLPTPPYTPDRATRFYGELISRLAALPGVRSAAAGWPLPFGGGNPSSQFELERRTFPPGYKPSARVHCVTPAYFHTLQMRLLEGREFTERDDMNSRPVVIVDDTFARQYFPNEDPIGKRIKPSISMSVEPPWREIVAVVNSTKLLGLAENFQAQYYIPYAQLPGPIPEMIVKTNGNALPIYSTIRSAVFSMDKNVPVYDIKSMDDLISASAGRERLNTLLFGIFGGLALLLASVGIYGVANYSVNRAVHEIGIRMALGAQSRDVLELALKTALSYVLAGVIAGIAITLALTRFMASFLYSVRPADPVILGVACALLAIVALIATYIPARRATKVDPMVALRYE